MKKTIIVLKKRNGFYGEITILRLDNGREWYAPSGVFELITP